ncbi:BZ3500_MvSof-1268-A1-R1_Chr1-3g02492 [Microbotryum saponariae]|uniref:GPN-loop GTPase n=1 Tax=Microbotryum saponariae TaxID=289078 RepID=A0A2X0LBR5_9BASI|nr:BZ3500_MvSof-1268-A1-R1_Chr1-3g02492 [Microbotryum saponariae]SCZ96391.1 BZ3501_MvSof-1269-A2-R1_Chr1-3g02095 [Microbotryum saponariae]
MSLPPTDKGKAKEATPPTTPATPATAPSADAKATGIIVIGMAGSGKTTLLQRLNTYLHSTSRPPYLINLDPAVSHLPFSANIDIRDTVDYQKVMQQYNLGPNGGILTALNLFTTKFDQVLELVDKRKSSVEYVPSPIFFFLSGRERSSDLVPHLVCSYVLLDTPGQIEIFTWSASGAIITDALASSLPTCVAYIIDTPRTTNPATFMSNMLYACSILYKTRLPFILVFNKTDVEPHHFALEWMRDFEAFQEALLARRSSPNGGEGSSAAESGGYMDSLMNSMSLVLDEFYKHLRAVGVSAMTGEGVPEFFDAVQRARQEYIEEYLPELNKTLREREVVSEKEKKSSLQRLMGDLKLGAQGPEGAEGLGRELEEEEEEEEEEESESDDDGEIIDRSARTGYYELPEPERKGRRGNAFGGGGGVGGDDGTVWPRP